ncbi:MAG: GNAT family N-acetyltransferase [Gammaproteobacteria bacterium]|nr:GNAT family N-acetyltransferase [Gammaproteobacteria bacterium]
MAGHVLDNPVWHALSTQHAGLALTADGAARYPAAIVPFAAVGVPSPRAADQLTSLIDDDESLFVVGVTPQPPPGWKLEPKKPVLQMVCNARTTVVDGPPVSVMTAENVPDMIGLTDLVFPGFFRARTLDMGRYYGIYHGSLLAAMGGERMRLDGYQELSAVCTHPDYAGRGYAHRLLGILCSRAFDQGFTPFLHVYADNTRAIGVYRRMSFADRTVLPFWALHQ